MSLKRIDSLIFGPMRGTKQGPGQGRMRYCDRRSPNDP